MFGYGYNSAHAARRTTHSSRVESLTPTSPIGTLLLLLITTIATPTPLRCHSAVAS